MMMFKNFRAIALLLCMILLCGCAKNTEQQVAEQLELGQRYLEEGDYEAAIVAFKKAIEIDPKQVEAYLALADVYVEMGDYDSALDILQQGLENTGEDERIKDKIAQLEAENPSGASGTSGDASGQEASGGETDAGAGNEPVMPPSLIDEQVLMDQDGVKVTALALYKMEEYGFFMPLRVENGTDEILEVSANECVVNGYMVEPSYTITQGQDSTYAQPNGEIEFELTFDKHNIEPCGIEEITDIELNFVALAMEEDLGDGASSWRDYSTGDRVHIQVAADGYEQTYDDSGAVLFDGSGIKIAYKYTGETDRGMGGKQVEALWLYIENNTDKDIYVYGFDTFVDGQEVDMSINCQMAPETRAMTEVTFYQAVESSYVESFQTVETRFRVTEVNGFDFQVETPSVSIPL